jgi:hypothetical protein
MARIASKSTGNQYNGKWAEVTLDDGRRGSGKSGGFFRGTTHEAVSKAVQDANSKPVPKSR